LCSTGICSLTFPGTRSTRRGPGRNEFGPLLAAGTADKVSTFDMKPLKGGVAGVSSTTLVSATERESEMSLPGTSALVGGDLKETVYEKTPG